MILSINKFLSDIYRLKINNQLKHNVKFGHSDEKLEKQIKNLRKFSMFLKWLIFAHSCDLFFSIVHFGWAKYITTHNPAC